MEKMLDYVLCTPMSVVSKIDTISNEPSGNAIITNTEAHLGDGINFVMNDDL